MSECENGLIHDARTGDIASFEALVRPYQKSLYRLLLSITANADDADDAFQETIVHAFTSIAKFRGDASLSTWLYRIALNVGRNWVRSQARASSERYATKFGWPPDENLTDPETALLSQERRREVHQMLLALPDHYREPLLLRHYDNMCYEDIATVLRIPLGTVRSRLAQGRRLLAKALNEERNARPDTRR